MRDMDHDASHCNINGPHAPADHSPTVFFGYIAADKHKSAWEISSALHSRLLNDIFTPFVFGSDSLREFKLFSCPFCAGQAQSEDKRKPGIPPPPLDAGPGLINLSGRDDLETRRAPFVKPLSTPPAQPLTPPEPESSPEVANEASVSGKEEGKESWLLPSPLTPEQRVIVLGMIGLTVVAFGKSSEGVVPEEVLEFLQVR